MEVSDTEKLPQWLELLVGKKAGKLSTYSSFVWLLREYPTLKKETADHRSPYIAFNAIASHLVSLQRRNRVRRYHWLHLSPWIAVCDRLPARGAATSTGAASKSCWLCPWRTTKGGGDGKRDNSSGASYEIAGSGEDYESISPAWWKLWVKLGGYVTPAADQLLDGETHDGFQVNREQEDLGGKEAIRVAEDPKTNRTSLIALSPRNWRASNRRSRTARKQNLPKSAW